jgi:hypothetical protein
MEVTEEEDMMRCEMIRTFLKFFNSSWISYNRDVPSRTISSRRAPEESVEARDSWKRLGHPTIDI